MCLRVLGSAKEKISKTKDRQQKLSEWKHKVKKKPHTK